MCHTPPICELYPVFFVQKLVVHDVVNHLFRHGGIVERNRQHHGITRRLVVSELSSSQDMVPAQPGLRKTARELRGVHTLEALI